MEVVSEQVITDAESKEILEAREKKGELKYEQKKALEILRKFEIPPAEKIQQLVKELMKITKLRDKHAVMIANFLPEDRDDLRAILHKEYNMLTEDELNLILETVRKFI
jgi:DNA-directed RNA polymerase subunit F